MLVHLLRTAPLADRDEALALVGPPGEQSGLARAERIERVIGLLEAHGSIDYACAFADGLAGAALTEFDPALGSLPDSRDKAFLRSLVLHLRDPEIRGR
jgi:geranylgeranyl pyrophosphate synthase